MAINFSENLKIGYPAPTRTTDVVGVNVQGLPPSTYADKDAIPTYMRSLYMKVTDQNGVEWRLEDATDLTVWTEIVAPTGGGDTTKDITASIAAGAISIGDVVPTGTDLTTFVETLIAPLVLPIVGTPNRATLNGIVTGILEVGDRLQTTLTTAYNRGTIQSKDGHPDVPLTGAAGTAHYSGAGIGSTTGVIDMRIIAGNNYWSVGQDYGAETAPYYDSKGNVATNLDSQRGPGTANDNSNIIIGRYRYWHVAGSIPTTSAGVRLLTSTGFFPVNSFSINIPQGETKVAFYLPDTVGNITVRYVESANSDVTSDFVPGIPMDINDAGGVPVHYLRFETTIPGIGYDANATYTVTIS